MGLRAAAVWLWSFRLPSRFPIRFSGLTSDAKLENDFVHIGCTIGVLYGLLFPLFRSFALGFAAGGIVLGIRWRRNLGGNRSGGTWVHLLAFPLAAVAYTMFLGLRYDSSMGVSRMPVYWLHLTVAVGLYILLFVSVVLGFMSVGRDVIPTVVLNGIFFLLFSPLVALQQPVSRLVAASEVLVSFSFGALLVMLVASCPWTERFGNIRFTIYILSLAYVALPLLIVRLMSNAPADTQAITILIVLIAGAQIASGWNIISAIRRHWLGGDGNTVRLRYPNSLPLLLCFVPVFLDVSVIFATFSIVPVAGVILQLRSVGFLSRLAVVRAVVLAVAGAAIQLVFFLFYDKFDLFGAGSPFGVWVVRVLLRAMVWSLAMWAGSLAAAFCLGARETAVTGSDPVAAVDGPTLAH